jgi:signal peptidase I
MTPLSFPFVHHTMPMSKTAKSFSEAWERPYMRMAGLRKIKNNDVVVFNFPEGDTVCVENQAPSYYDMVRRFGRNNVWNKYTVIHRPVDKCENYIKRCVAIPGDSLKIVDGQLYINGKAQEKIGKRQYKYAIITDGSNINPKTLQKMGIARDDIEQGYMGPGYYEIPLTEDIAQRIGSFNFVKQIQKVNAGHADGSSYIFPQDKRYKWNEDNFGPLWVPKKVQPFT